jgi:SWI/SNF-related matrix-associated actin-dependent regulator 1 of chromatin subfamily A
MFSDVLDAVLPPGHGKGYKTFRDYFCDVTQTTYGDKIVGNKRDRIPTLIAAFEPHYIRRRKEDVMSQLGAIAYRDLPVDVHAPGVHVEAELDAVVNGVLALQPDDVAAMNMLRDLLSRHEEAFAIRRHALGVLKVVPVAAWIDDFLEAHPDEKVLLFAHHKEVLRRYESALKHYLPAVITGETSMGARANAVDRFQNDPLTRVFIGQNVAASTSVTLTAGSTVVMAEPDYTPNVNYQAISRAHRIGQLRPVIAYFAFAAGTMDQSLTRILRRRTADFAQMFDKINDQP